MTMMIAGLTSTVFMGLTLGILGAGGSILTVPILVFLMKVEVSEATAYSLFIVGITALIGALSYHKKGLIRFKTGLIFAFPAFIGVYATRLFVIPALPENIMQIGAWEMSKDALTLIVFAVIMILAAYAMIKPSGVKSKKTASQINIPLIAVEGLLVGGVTGFVGAGGGFLIIPALVILAGLPMKEAVGTSLMIISIKSLLGFTGDIQAGMQINWTLMLGLSSLSIIGTVLGELVSHKIDGNKLKPLFGYFVLVMGIGMLLREFMAGMS